MRTLLALLLCLTLPALGQELSLQGNPHQGFALFLRVKGAAPGTQGTVRWLNQEYPLSAAGDDGVMSTVLPVDIDAPVKVNPLVVELDDGSRLERKVPVKARHYGHQSISLNPATLASYDDPQNKADDEAILAALAPFEETQLWTGDFTVPVKAPETTGFGLRRTYNGWKKGWHKGLDLAGWEGEAVLAPADGVVLHTARGIVNGNTVVLGHGLGVGSSYLHLDSIDVREGQRVRRGERIGTVGGTGGFAPHLHWEVRVHGVPVHPKAMYSLPGDWR